MANASQFIGSKISLISKAEIRYEGILYSLDLQEATISLAKVRSFGTEDRPTEKPVPPKDEVYEFIIFRGSDIKGIDVIEPPKQAPTISGGLPNDPAIVEVSHYHTQAQNQYSQQRGSGPFGGGSTIMGKPPVHSSFFDGLIGRSNVSTPSAYGSSRKSPTNDSGNQGNDGRNRNQQMNRQQGNGRRGQQGQGRMSPRQDRQQMQRRGQNNQGFMPRGRGNFGNRGNNGGNFQMMNRGQGRGQGRPRGNRGTPGVFKAQTPAKVTYDEAYDFEKANAELEDALSKLKLEKSSDKKEGENVNGEGVKENEEQENKEPIVYYNKDNFFDSISCEALERTKGKPPRVDWKAEKKLNVETFGAAANGPRYGGFRGGFRGRGQYSGGGGYGGYGGYGGGRGGYQSRGYGYNQRSGRGGNRNF